MATASAVRDATAVHTTAGGLLYLIRPGPINRLRPLAGMVRNNTARHSPAGPVTTAAAGTGTGAFGIFYASIWAMADALPPARLTFSSIAVIAALTAWLIFYNGLWPPSAPYASRAWRSRWAPGRGQRLERRLRPGHRRGDLQPARVRAASVRREGGPGLTEE